MNQMAKGKGEKRLFPAYIFESSWEVCNKVGGIYTVLSTRAKTLQEYFTDSIIFIGPDCWTAEPCPYFEEDGELFADWRQAVAPSEENSADGLRVRVGRWLVPGRPIAVLVDFTPFYQCKNEIYTQLWNDFAVDSLHAYGDYDEASMFSYAAGRVVESFYRHYLAGRPVVYHGNEWMTGLGLLYVKKHVPEIATIFTTHATSIGRSIAGNNKPLYDYLSAYNGDQMAEELNMQSKHSIEKQTAWNVDCFTTVSDITARECEQLLDKAPDVVLPNGFDDSFVPTGMAFARKRRAARRRLLEVASRQTGVAYGKDVLIVSTSGRYEFRNKGIDVFIESMNRLRWSEGLNRQIVAFIEVPGCLNDDRVRGMLNWLGLHNAPEDKVHVIVVPSYLTGNDGLLNLPYYDVLIGNDLTVYPSYYEPWGYTPLESIAFKVPCITTDLAGFGLWANAEKRTAGYSAIEDGVKVVHRTDYNYDEVADEICQAVLTFAQCTTPKATVIREKACRLSKKALWSVFIEHYMKAYHIALERNQKANQ